MAQQIKSLILQLLFNKSHQIQKGQEIWTTIRACVKSKEVERTLPLSSREEVSAIALCGCRKWRSWGWIAHCIYPLGEFFLRTCRTGALRRSGRASEESHSLIVASLNSGFISCEIWISKSAENNTVRKICIQSPWMTSQQGRYHL